MNQSGDGNEAKDAEIEDLHTKLKEQEEKSKNSEQRSSLLQESQDAADAEIAAKAKEEKLTLQLKEIVMEKLKKKLSNSRMRLMQVRRQCLT